MKSILLATNVQGDEIPSHHLECEHPESYNLHPIDRTYINTVKFMQCQHQMQGKSITTAGPGKPTIPRPFPRPFFQLSPLTQF
jgi:hypothetical protein